MKKQRGIIEAVHMRQFVHENHRELIVTQLLRQIRGDDDEWTKNTDHNRRIHIIGDGHFDPRMHVDRKAGRLHGFVDGAVVLQICMSPQLPNNTVAYQDPAEQQQGAHEPERDDDPCEGQLRRTGRQHCGPDGTPRRACLPDR